jgi:Glyoxalase-like domain
VTTGFQVTFDAHEPERLARFWAGVLGYVEQPPPPGFADADAFMASLGVAADWRERFFAIVDPEGKLPRVYFQRVPEGKTAKNRVHLDVNVGAGLSGDDRRAAVRRRADDLVALGAIELRDHSENGEYWIVLQDVEGNEFCVQ